jgi:hypothetical protein
MADKMKTPLENSLRKATAFAIAPVLALGMSGLFAQPAAAQNVTTNLQNSLQSLDDICNGDDDEKKAEVDCATSTNATDDPPLTRKLELDATAKEQAQAPFSLTEENKRY